MALLSNEEQGIRLGIFNKGIELWGKISWIVKFRGKKKAENASQKLSEGKVGEVKRKIKA